MAIPVSSNRVTRSSCKRSGNELFVRQLLTIGGDRTLRRNGAGDFLHANCQRLGLKCGQVGGSWVSRIDKVCCVALVCAWLVFCPSSQRWWRTILAGVLDASSSGTVESRCVSLSPSHGRLKNHRQAVIVVNLFRSQRCCEQWETRLTSAFCTLDENTGKFRPVHKKCSLRRTNPSPKGVQLSPPAESCLRGFNFFLLAFCR